MSILVYIELDNGGIKKSSVEAITYGSAIAKTQGGTVTVIAIGKAEQRELAKAGIYGANKVIHAGNPQLEQKNALAYSDVVAQVAQISQSKLIILSKSSLGDAVAARLAGKLKAGIVSGAIELPIISGNTLKVKQGIYSGKAFAWVEVQSDIKIISIRKNTIEAQTNHSDAQVEPFTGEVNASNFSGKVINVEKTNNAISLTDADIIVSGGRGMKGPENWQPLLDLAAELGAATGCSKPVSDLDWRPHHEHIGQTGIKVAPNLYIACGISGAIQHLAGVNSSKYIVVINKDADAPFFKAADYGIVGDVFEILPQLTQALKDSK